MFPLILGQRSEQNVGRQPKDWHCLDPPRVSVPHRLRTRRKRARGSARQKTVRLWKSKCAACHGADGKGDTDQGKKMKVANMATAAYQKSFTDDQLKNAILNGVKTEKDGVKKEMDPFKDELTPDQVNALVQFIRALPTSGPSGLVEQPSS